MRIDVRKFDLACANACVSRKDLIGKGIPKGTLTNVVNKADLRPKTVGRIARALNVPVESIVED